MVNGKVDRAKLSAKVVHDPAAIRRLEQIVHPMLRAYHQKFLDDAEKSGAPVALVDVPLLFETGAQRRFDRVIVTACSADLQLARLKARGLTEDAARQRLAAQWPTEKRIAGADFVIHTDGAFDDTDRQVRDVNKALGGPV